MAAAFADVDPSARALLTGAAGCSPYLGDLMRREAEWLARRWPRPRRPPSPRCSRRAAARTTARSPPRSAPPSGRTALLVALADLGGAWDLDAVTGALTDLADRAVHAALTALVAEEIARGKLPGVDPRRHPRGGRHVRARHGQDGRARAQLLVRHRPDRALRRDPPRARRLRRPAPRLHPGHPAPGEAARRAHRGRLRLPHRPAAAPRPPRRPRSASPPTRPSTTTRASAAPGSAPPSSRRGPAPGRPAPARRSSTASAPSSGAGTSTSPRSRTPTTCGCASAPTRA